ncbi:hypothetical protein AAG747_19220 [Rapidithrix thailandica]|uniref:Lipocalin-like domain-containing protein n=1 Tax=Rapidithrix thailandica TaxID=413964 RepID=A0AAW9RYR8_9BACT
MNLNFILKSVVIIAVLMCFQDLNAQSIIGKYYINKIIGRNLNDSDEFILTEIKPNEKKEYVYGNIITFNEDYSFTCTYFAPCGNDCFPSSDGTFELITNNKIKLLVKGYSQEGDCESKLIKLNFNLGIYCISTESENTIKFIKQNK